MSADDEQHRHGGTDGVGGTGGVGGGKGSGSNGAGTTGDPLRELMFGFAAQIDQLASMFGGASWRNAAGQPTDAAAGDVPRGAQLDGDAAVGFAGEISTLIAEIGDLLARLIAALIAVLEAIAKALRQTPDSVAAEPMRGYQSIRVHMAADREQSDGHRPEAESAPPSSAHPDGDK